MAEGGGGFLASARDSYENFVTSLEEKGVPSPRVIIPVIAAIILIAIVFTIVPSLLNPTTAVEFTIMGSDGAPVQGADVVLSSGNFEATSRTLTTGKVSFDKVPQASSYSLSITAPGYQPKSAVVSNGDSITLSAATPSQKKTFKLKVVNQDNTEVEGAGVTLSFSDGNKIAESTDVFGEAVFDLTGVTQKIALADVSKDGFDGKTKSVSLDDGIITIQLTENKPPVDQTKGDFIVNIDATDAQGVVVTLVDTYTNSPVASASADANGKALLPALNLHSKFYITASDPQGRYLNYENSQDVVSFETNLQQQTITLQAQPSNKDGLTITVKNKAGDRLSGADVRVYDKSTRVLYDESSTDSNGNARFNVAGKTYYITAYAEGYAPGFADNARKGDTKTVTLDNADETQVTEATFQVTENGDPVPDAEVELFKANGFAFGFPTINTAADGTAKFNLPLLLDGKTYKAYAVARSGNKVGRSDIADVAEGVLFAVSVQAPPANVTLVAKSLLGNDTVEDASFSVITPTDTIISDCSAPCSVSLPSEVQVRIVASASGFLQTTSAPISFAPGESRTVQVFLYPQSLSRKNSINFLGFYDEAGNQVSELGRAEKYRAKFVVALGEKSDAFAFFQAGENADNKTDIIHVTGIHSGIKAKNMLSGQSAEDVCSPSGGTQTENVKWIELDYASMLGASEVSIDFTTSDNAPASSEAKILYRLGGTTVAGKIPFTSPQDDDLITQLLSQAVKDRGAFCAAKTNSASIKVQSKPMTCKNGLCSRVTLEREDGFKTSGNLPVKLGDQFTVNFDLFAPGESIDTVSVSEDSTFEVVSGSVGQLNLADRTFTATGTERASGSITFRALKQSSATVLRLKIAFTSEKPPIELQKGVEITGKNSFTVSFTPSTAASGDSVRAKAILIDSLGKPVTDAQVTLANCDEAKQVIQDSKIVLGNGDIGLGADGAYEFRFTPNGVGNLCLEARGDGFETKLLEPAMSVTAQDFLTANPEQLAFTGPADSQQPKQVEVISSLNGVKLKISAMVNRECANLLLVTPSVKDKVEGSSQFTIGLITQSVIEADCAVAFIGEANSQTKATVIIPVSIKTTTPDCAATNSCPQQDACGPDNACLTPQDGQSFGCTPRNDLACDSGKTCFVCGTGLDNVGSITLDVSNLKNDRKVYPLMLTFDPQFNEEFDLVWDQPFNTQLPVQTQPQFQYQQQQLGNYPTQGPVGYNQFMTQQYGVSPYYSFNYPLGIGQGYAQYQTLPYYNNPIRAGVPPEPLGTQYPYQQVTLPGAFNTQYQYGYNQNMIPPQYCAPGGFGQTCGGIANAQCPQGSTCQIQAGDYGRCVPITGNYPGITPGQPVVPPYCYNYVYNQQSAFAGQYAGMRQSPYNTGAPFGYPANCQYPTMCQNPQACGYVATGQQGFYGQFGPQGSTPPECQYPAICNNPGACKMYNGVQGGQATGQFKQVGNPVKVSVEITKQQLVVSAVYSGDEYFTNGGQGASARGTLIVRDARGIEKKRISISVSVRYSGTIIPPQQPGVNQLPQPIPQILPQPFPQQIPPECMALFYPQSCTQGPGGQASLLQIPDMTVVTNVYTGHGLSEYAIEPPRVGAGRITCAAQTSLTGVTCNIGNTATAAPKPSGKPPSASDLPPGTKQSTGIQAGATQTSGKSTILLTAQLPANRKLDEDTGKVSVILTTQAENKIEKEFTVRKDDFIPQKIQLFILDKFNIPDKAVIQPSTTVLAENCAWKGKYAEVKCNADEDGNIIANSGTPGSGDMLTIKGLGDNQVRDIPVIVSLITHNFNVDGKGKANYVLRLSDKPGKERKATGSFYFKPGLVYPDNSLKVEVEGASDSACVDCITATYDNKNNGQILVVADYSGSTGVVMDYFFVKIILPENVGDDSYKIPLLVTTDQEQTDITKPIISVPLTAVANGPVRVHLFWPLGDDPEQRIVEVKGYSAPGPNQVVRTIMTVKGEDAGKDFDFTMVNTEGSHATVTASTKFPGALKPSNALPKTVNTELAKNKASNTGVDKGKKLQTKIDYGTCTVSKGKLTKKTTSSGTVTLSKGVSSTLGPGKCIDKDACTAAGGSAYSGFCKGPAKKLSNIQCCITGGSRQPPGKHLKKVCLNDEETQTFDFGDGTHSVSFEDNSDKFGVYGQVTIDSEKCLVSGTTSGTCGAYTVDSLDFDGGRTPGYCFEVYAGSSTGTQNTEKTQNAPNPTDALSSDNSDHTGLKKVRSITDSGNPSNIPLSIPSAGIKFYSRYIRNFETGEGANCFYEIKLDSVKEELVKQWRLGDVYVKQTVGTFSFRNGCSQKDLASKPFTSITEGNFDRDKTGLEIAVTDYAGSSSASALITPYPHLCSCQG